MIFVIFFFSQPFSILVIVNVVYNALANSFIMSGIFCNFAAVFQADDYG